MNDCLILIISGTAGIAIPLITFLAYCWEHTRRKWARKIEKDLYDAQHWSDLVTRYKDTHDRWDYYS